MCSVAWVLAAVALSCFVSMFVAILDGVGLACRLSAPRALTPTTRRPHRATGDTETIMGQRQRKQGMTTREINARMGEAKKLYRQGRMTREDVIALYERLQARRREGDR